MRLAAPLVALTVTLCGAVVLAQEPVPRPPQTTRPIVRSSTELVEVSVVITDRHGLPVRGLTQDDFQITEDGRAQDIATFGFLDLPSPAGTSSNAAGTRPPRDEVATNSTPGDRRVYVVALDAFNVDPSRSDGVRKEARRFIADYLAPDDLAAVIILGYGLRNQPFTSDKGLLTAAVDQFIGQKSRSATLNVLADAASKQAGRQGAEVAAEDAETGSKANQARLMLESLKQICQSLGAASVYRRSVVLFSEGIELDTTNLIGEDKRPSAGGQGLKFEAARYAPAVLDAWQSMVDAARRANVAIYAIEPRGNTMGVDDIMQATVERDPITGRPLPPATLGMMREATRGQGSLRTFASETGGFAVVGTDDFAAGFSRVVQANSSYYVIGYRPANAVHDGKYRKISVAVRARDVDVVARKGYYAVEDNNASAALSGPPAPMPGVPLPNAASPRMRELLSSPLPVRAGLDLRVTGGPLRRQGDRTLVALFVEIDTTDLAFVNQSGLLSNDVEFALLVLDAQGKMRAANRSVGNLRLPGSERATVTHGLNTLSSFLSRLVVIRSGSGFTRRPAAPGEPRCSMWTRRTSADPGCPSAPSSSPRRWRR